MLQKQVFLTPKASFFPTGAAFQEHFFAPRARGKVSEVFFKVDWHRCNSLCHWINALRLFSRFTFCSFAVSRTYLAYISIFFSRAQRARFARALRARKKDTARFARLFYRRSTSTNRNRTPRSVAAGATPSPPSFPPFVLELRKCVKFQKNHEKSMVFLVES